MSACLLWVGVGDTETRIVCHDRRATRERRRSMFAMVLTAVSVGFTGGTVRAHALFRRLHRQVSGTTMGSATVKETTEGAQMVWEMVERDHTVYITSHGYGLNLRSVIEMEIQNYEQGEATPDRRVLPSGRKAAAEVKVLERKVTAGLEALGAGAPARKKQTKYIIKITFDARQISKTKAQTEVMLLLIPEGREGQLYCQSAMRIRTLAVYTGKDSKELLQSNLAQMLEQMQEVRTNGLRYCSEKDAYLDQNPGAALMGDDRNVEVEFVLPADMCALFGLHGHGGARDPNQEFCTQCKCRMDQRHTPFQLIRVANETTVAGIAKQFSMPPQLFWALNAGSDPSGMLGKAELTDAALHYKTQPLEGVEATPATGAPRYKEPSAICLALAY